MSEESLLLKLRRACGDGSEEELLNGGDTDPLILIYVKPAHNSTNFRVRNLITLRDSSDSSFNKEEEKGPGEHNEGQESCFEYATNHKSSKVQHFKL